MGIYPTIKRTIDFTLALLALITLWPLFIIIALIIKIDSKGPILFIQERFGKNKKTFNILKFRTMCADTPKNVPTYQLKDPEACITKVGRFLRKTSLDELPQIVNILKGEMSIIGPRPVILIEEKLINIREQYGANDILPGITGWAQVNGRDELTDKEKAMFDGEYVKKMCFTFDLRIFFKTVFYVIKKEGIKEGDQKVSVKLVVDNRIKRDTTIIKESETYEKNFSIR